MPTGSVITPITGSSLLGPCVESVFNLTYVDVKSLTVIDGPEYIEPFRLRTAG